MTYKVGQIFYWVAVEPDGKCSMEEHHVRTIRGGYVHAIWKHSFTWGKRSTKNGDFGWLRNIPAWCRDKWPETGKPHSKFTTKRQAIVHELKTLTVDDFDSDAGYERATRTLRAMKTRL